MSDINLTKNVLSGSAEYTSAAGVAAGTRTLNAGDSLRMLFDNDIIIDDLVISAFNATSLAVELYLVFPTGHSMPVVTAGGAPSTALIAGPNAVGQSIYQLNSNETNRNMWFRIPKWATLEIFISEVTTPGSFQVSVTGRG